MGICSAGRGDQWSPTKKCWETWATIGRPYNKFQFVVLVVISKTGFILHDLPFSDQYIQIADNSASQNTTSDNRPENIDKPFGAAVPNQRRNQQEHRNDTKAYSQRFAQLSGLNAGSRMVL